MAILVDARNRHRYQRELEASYRLRHRVFVEKMGWEVLRQPDGREIDQFDTEHAVHVIEMGDEEAIFSSRLLPTTQPHLLSHIYPEILQGQPAPSGRHVWEQTRATLLPRRLPSGMPNPMAARASLAMIEASIFVGAEIVLVEVHPLLITRLAEHGYRPQPIALPYDYDGQPVVAMRLIVDAHTLDTTRRFYDQWSPALTVDGELAPAARRRRRVA